METNSINQITGAPVDPTVCQSCHHINNIDVDDIKLLLKSPIWGGLIKQLDYCGIIVGVQYEENSTEAILYTRVPFDIKKVIVDRERAKKNTEE